MKEEIQKRIEEQLLVLEKLFDTCGPGIDELGKRLIQTLESGHKLIVFGNRGSAADAQHFACELVGSFLIKTRRALPAIALRTNTSSLTSIANDFTFDRVFKRQIEALARPGDLCVGSSTSGNSMNVHEALKTAKDRGCSTAALLGAGGGKIKDVADISIIVPSQNTPRIQEAHILIIHILCQIVDEKFSTL